MRSTCDCADHIGGGRVCRRHNALKRNASSGVQLTPGQRGRKILAAEGPNSRVPKKKRVRRDNGVLPAAMGCMLAAAVVCAGPKPAGQMVVQPMGVGGAIGTVPVVGAQHAPDMWFVNGHRPSAGEVKKQMDAMYRRQAPSTPKAARNRMAHAVSKAREAGERVAMRQHDKGVVEVPPPSFEHLVGDGRASSVWRRRILAGQRVPSPFLTGGKVGKNADFSLSAVREYLQLKAEGRLPGGEALGPAPGESVAVPADPVVSAVEFIAGMTPADAEGAQMPEWVARLLDGDLDQGSTFWG